MTLSELLTPEAVIPRLKASDKRSALAELVEQLERGHGLSSQGEILDRVLRREAMMSTGIGNGVAIPHGKAKAVDRMLAALAVSEPGVAFESVDNEPAHIFILLVSPEAVGAAHVKVLANISRLFKEESVRQSIRSSSNAMALLSALKDAESRFLT